MELLGRRITSLCHRRVIRGSGFFVLWPMLDLEGLGVEASHRLGGLDVIPDLSIVTQQQGQQPIVFVIRLCTL